MYLRGKLPALFLAEGLNFGLEGGEHINGTEADVHASGVSDTDRAAILNLDIFLAPRIAHDEACLLALGQDHLVHYVTQVRVLCLETEAAQYRL